VDKVVEYFKENEGEEAFTAILDVDGNSKVLIIVNQISSDNSQITNLLRRFCKMLFYKGRNWGKLSMYSA